MFAAATAGARDEAAATGDAEAEEQDENVQLDEAAGEQDLREEQHLDEGGEDLREGEGQPYR